MSPRHRQSMLAKIHLAVKQLGLDDETYRALLVNLFGAHDKKRAAKWAAGKPSAADLRAAELGQLVEHFFDRGFRVIAPARAKKAEPPPQKGVKEAYLSRINALLAEHKRPWAYAHAIARQMYGVDRVHWLPDDGVRDVMLALARDDARKRKAASRGDAETRRKDKA